MAIIMGKIVISEGKKVLLRWKIDKFPFRIITEIEERMSKYTQQSKHCGIETDIVSSTSMAHEDYKWFKAQRGFGVNIANFFWWAFRTHMFFRQGYKAEGRLHKDGWRRGDEYLCGLFLSLFDADNVMVDIKGWETQTLGKEQVQEYENYLIKRSYRLYRNFMEKCRDDQKIVFCKTTCEHQRCLISNHSKKNPNYKKLSFDSSRIVFVDDPNLKKMIRNNEIANANYLTYNGKKFEIYSFFKESPEHLRYNPKKKDGFISRILRPQF